jgi:hypothetical protein
MALSRDEVNRLLAEAAAAQRGQIHQLSPSTLLSKAQIEQLSTIDAHHRRERAREMVALEGRPWHREMDAQIEQMNNDESAQRRLAKPTTAAQARPISKREMREIAVPLDDLNEPPAKA